MPLRYLRNLDAGRLILWCYFIWYAVVVVRYFDPNPRLWATSLGLAVIIGVALVIIATGGAGGGQRRFRLPFWVTFRFFLMPFCVSSFSALVKDKGFVLIFSPNPWEVVVAVALCAALFALALLARVIPEFRP